MASGHDAFGRFYRDNVRGLRAYVSRLLSGSAEADDIANEAFAKVLSVSTEERPVPPKAYLFATARNLAINHTRWAKVRGPMRTIEDVSDVVADDAPTAEEDLVARERLALMWEAIDQLRPRTRQVFIMRKIEHVSNLEIAERLGLSVSAVEKHIAKGLRNCRAHLDGREEGKTMPGREGIRNEGSRHG